MKEQAEDDKPSMGVDQTIELDPKDLIQPPFIGCPRCGGNAFGVLYIQGQ